ncbi:MAG: hypothetical protein EXR77_09485, partial [Myxococcales bacterium]|nr:hypothetical protein [Myxococcales bacterium]
DNSSTDNSSTDNSSTDNSSTDNSSNGSISIGCGRNDFATSGAMISSQAASGVYGRKTIAHGRRCHRLGLDLSAKPVHRRWQRGRRDWGGW